MKPQIVMAFLYRLGILQPSACLISQIWPRDPTIESTPDFSPGPPAVDSDQMRYTTYTTVPDRNRNIDAEVLFAQARTLEYYNTKSDCFRAAAASVRSDCSKSELAEDERTSAAIAMTLCEISTARQHSVPMECMPFWVEAGNVDDQLKFRSSCVEALSRSAQHWSSYSGYMREIPQLCFMFRRWHDSDTAKLIYQNVTLEKVQLLRSLNIREQRSDVALHVLETRLQELRDSVTDLRVIGQAVTSMRESVELEMHTAVKEIMAQALLMWGDFRRQDERHRAKIVSDIEDKLETVAFSHYQALTAALPILETSITDRMQDFFLSIEERNQILLMAMSQAQVNWDILAQNFNEFHHGMKRMTIENLDLSSQIAQRLHESLDVQTEATRAALRLEGTILNLTQFTKSELLAISNASTAVLQNLEQNFSKNFFYFEPWCIFKRLSLALLSFAAYVMPHSTLRLVLSSMGILWTVLSYRLQGISRFLFGKNERIYLNSKLNSST